MKCIKEVEECNSPCSKCECRYWIEYEDDLNCSNISIKKYGKMKFEDIGDRLHISGVRVKQIEQDTFKKLIKNKNLLIIQE